MTATLGALVGVLATLGAVSLGAWLSRRNEQRQWIRDICKRVYLDFLYAAFDFENNLDSYYAQAIGNPTFWMSTKVGSPVVLYSLGQLSSTKAKLDRAREETQVFGDDAVDSAQEWLFQVICEGFNGVSREEKIARVSIPAVRRSLDGMSEAISQYKQAIRASFKH